MYSKLKTSTLHNWKHRCAALVNFGPSWLTHIVRPKLLLFRKWNFYGPMTNLQWESDRKVWWETSNKYISIENLSFQCYILILKIQIYIFFHRNKKIDSSEAWTINLWICSQILYNNIILILYANVFWKY